MSRIEVVKFGSLKATTTTLGQGPWSDTATHVIVVTGTEDIKIALKELRLSADAISTRVATSVDSQDMQSFIDKDIVVTGNHRVVFHMLNADIPYNTMRGIARACANIGGDVCVHVTFIPNALRVPLMHIIAKHCYAFVKYRTGMDFISDKSSKGSSEKGNIDNNLKSYLDNNLKSNLDNNLKSNIDNNLKSNIDNNLKKGYSPKKASRKKGNGKTLNPVRKIYIFDRHAKCDKDIDDLINAARALGCADIARNLENEPANHMTPHMFCENAMSILKKVDTHRKLKFKVLDEKEMDREGLRLVLAVGQSSSSHPRFMAVEYIQNKKYPTICLIGKGVTFDAGGLRLKPAVGMVDMKQDKSGAAIVVSILHHLLKYHANTTCQHVNFVGLTPLVENVINGKAVKPGDIVKAHNGSNVEILDPDAEGRLILADAISYSQKYYKPEYIIDFATLTAFASMICCDLSAVYHTLSEPLAAIVGELGEATGERVWRHPPWAEYKVNTMSPVADMRNANFECTRSGSFMAAMFISNFIPEDIKNKWVHFDISNNDIRGIHSGNCAFLGMQFVKRIVDELLTPKTSLQNRKSTRTRRTRTRKTQTRKTQTRRTRTQKTPTRRTRTFALKGRIKKITRSKH